MFQLIPTAAASVRQPVHFRQQQRSATAAFDR
jgi:hypothetical protein